MCGEKGAYCKKMFEGCRGQDRTWILFFSKQLHNGVHTINVKGWRHILGLIMSWPRIMGLLVFKVVDFHFIVQSMWMNVNPIWSNSNIIREATPSLEWLFPFSLELQI
jgi:hypothetical protein